MHLMPIRPAEVALFPPNLLDDEQPPAVGGCVWWLLHTRPRQEKCLAEQLHRKGISFYLPLMTKRLLVRGRALVSQVPLFPGYLFLWGGDEERVAALATSRVVRSIAVADQRRLQHDLRQVNGLIRSGAPITPEERLQPGAVVEIRSGVLAGLKGKIVRVASGHKFVVEVDFIHRGASVLMDGFVLEPEKPAFV